MTDTEKINILRETIELGAMTISACEIFISLVSQDTPGYKEIKKQIQHFKDVMEINFKPEVINGSDQ